MSSEREWLESARRPPAWTTTKERATREDLFLALDTMWQIGCEADLHLDSAFVAARTRARALASALIPRSQPRGYPCVCGISFAFGVDLESHQEICDEALAKKGVRA